MACNVMSTHFDDVEPMDVDGVPQCSSASSTLTPAMLAVKYKTKPKPKKKKSKSSRSKKSRPKSNATPKSKKRSRKNTGGKGVKRGRVSKRGRGGRGGRGGRSRGRTKNKLTYADIRALTKLNRSIIASKSKNHKKKKQTIASLYH